MWPRYSICSWNINHLFNFNITPASSNRRKTCSRWSKGYSSFLDNTILSSTYTKHILHRTPERTISRALWKVTGVLLKRNCMREYRYLPIWLVKVILSLSLPTIGTCQYLHGSSIFHNTFVSPRLSLKSSILGNGYDYSIFSTLRRLKSTQNRIVPSS